MVKLELKKLRKEFGGLVAVNDIDLRIEAGEIRGLIGPNGSGKTTLFNLISGFLPPTAGEIFWKGKDISGAPTYSIVKEGITRTFQLTKLLKDMTVLENVLVGCHLQVGTGLFRQVFSTSANIEKNSGIHKKAMDILELIGIDAVRNEIAGALPHGYQRALNIAIALATEPTLLLLDEVTTGMNPVETENMMNKIRMLRDEKNITILLVEHDMKTVMQNCDKISVMNFGAKIAEGTPEEVSNNDEVIEAYLGR